MRGHTQAVIAVVMAYAVMLILVSPAVPSPLTTVPTKLTLRPLQVIGMMTALPVTAAVEISNPLQDIVLSPPVRLGVSGAEVVDLNATRLC